MNAGQALINLLQHAALVAEPAWRIRRTVWVDGSYLTVERGQLVWWASDYGGVRTEPVSCLPASDIMAEDWEVVS